MKHTELKADAELDIIDAELIGSTDLGSGLG
jgi:hypothetical protein